MLATYQDKVILNVLAINFVSSIFNAGAFMTVYPFIIKRVGDGDAFILSVLMAIFFAGAAVSNALLLKFMPLRSPGKVFLIMQLLGSLFCSRCGYSRPGGYWWSLP